MSANSQTPWMSKLDKTGDLSMSTSRTLAAPSSSSAACSASSGSDRASSIQALFASFGGEKLLALAGAPVGCKPCVEFSTPFKPYKKTKAKAGSKSGKEAAK